MLNEWIGNASTRNAFYVCKECRYALLIMEGSLYVALSHLKMHSNGENDERCDDKKRVNALQII